MHTKENHQALYALLTNDKINVLERLVADFKNTFSKTLLVADLEGDTRSPTPYNFCNIYIKEISLTFH